MMAESKIVTSVGIAVSSSHGREALLRLSQAMQDDVLHSVHVGLDPAHPVHSGVIGASMQAHHDHELARFLEEQALGSVSLAQADVDLATTRLAAAQAGHGEACAATAAAHAKKLAALDAKQDALKAGL